MEELMCWAAAAGRVERSRVRLFHLAVAALFSEKAAHKFNDEMKR